VSTKELVDNTIMPITLPARCSNNNPALLNNPACSNNNPAYCYLCNKYFYKKSNKIRLMKNLHNQKRKAAPIYGTRPTRNMV